MTRIVRRRDKKTTNDDLRRTGSRGIAKSDYIRQFSSTFSREKVLGRGQTRRSQRYLSTALSSHPASGRSGNHNY